MQGRGERVKHIQGSSRYFDHAKLPARVSIEATVDRPLRMLAGAESRIDVTLSADAAASDLKNLLMSEVIFVGAAVSDGTAFFPLEADLIQGSAHARIRAGSPASRPVGEWTLTELFFDSDGAEFDRWVRAARTFEIDVVRFMGLDAAWAMRLIWGLITAALGCCGWGVLRMIRLHWKKKNER